METKSTDVSVGFGIVGAVSYASCSHSIVVMFLILLRGPKFMSITAIDSMGVIMPYRPNLLRFI